MLDLRRCPGLALFLTLLTLVPMPAHARGGGHGGIARATAAAPPASRPHTALPQQSGGPQPTAPPVTVAPSPPPAADAAPPPAIAAPLPELAPLAPLSPQLPTQFATGTSATGGLALSPGTPSSTPNSTSPSEAAPSLPGGGGKTLADCMGFWDRATHMSKGEWKAACIRTMAEEPSVTGRGYLQRR